MAVVLGNRLSRRTARRAPCRRCTPRSAARRSRRGRRSSRRGAGVRCGAGTPVLPRRLDRCVRACGSRAPPRAGSCCGPSTGGARGADRFPGSRKGREVAFPPLLREFSDRRQTVVRASQPAVTWSRTLAMTESEPPSQAAASLPITPSRRSIRSLPPSVQTVSAPGPAWAHHRGDAHGHRRHQDEVSRKVRPAHDADDEATRP